MILTKNISILASVALLTIKSLIAQPYPQYKTSPLDIAPDVSGSFCEMRSHHFHAGLDYRTQRKQGFSLRSVSDGWVHRIKISHYGYGKLIQIKHKDGFISHYAHCSSFASPIDSYVRKYQYENKTFEMEVFLPKNLIPVKEGQTIAYSGNTGGSQGPHLHFEIRDSTNSYAFNPFLFGLRINDTKKPILQGVKVYPVGDGTVNGKKSIVDLSVKKSRSGSYYISNPGLAIDGFFQLSYRAKDPQDGSGFHNGVYITQLYIDNIKRFEFKLDKVKLEDLRASDFHMDYANWVANGTYYEKLFVDDENPLEIYDREIAQSAYALSAGTHEIKIVLIDFKRNTTEHSFKITHTGNATEVVYDECKSKCYSSPNTYTQKDLKNRELTIKTPAHTFYNNKNSIALTVTDNANFYGEIDFSFGNKNIPTRKEYTIEYTPINPKVNLDKLIICGKNDKKLKYYATKVEKNKLVTKTKDIGNFTVWADTTAPVISNINIKDSMYVMFNHQIHVFATDNLTDIVSYHSYIDGNWELTEYEYKENLLFINLPKDISPGPHRFEIEVLDDKKNKAYKSVVFFVTYNVDDLSLNKKKKGK